jgi:hypothetical protein
MMATFITIGYGDRAGYEQTDPAVRDAAQTPGPFMRTDLPIAGFAVIEAESPEHAAELVSATPCAVAHGVVEVWPLRDTP